MTQNKVYKRSRTGRYKRTRKRKDNYISKEDLQLNVQRTTIENVIAEQYETPGNLEHV